VIFSHVFRLALTETMISGKCGAVLLVVLASTFVAAQSDVCQIPGDADILGLGVRLGLYFQFSSNLLIAAIRPSEGLASLLLSSIFATGILVATIYSLANQIMPPSAFISTQWFLLLDSAIINPVLTNVERLDLKERLSFWTLGFILFRVIAWNSLNLWFWFHGLYVENPQQCMEPRVFLFANCGAYGNVRKVFKASTIMTALYLGWYLVRWIMSFLARISDPEGTYKERWEVKMDYTMGFLPQGLYDEELVLPMPRGFGWTVFLFICGALGLIIAITGAELQFRWNNVTGIDGISTTGQIIPLVVGAVSLFRAVSLTILVCFFGVKEEDE
jgi:hypothetical protein